jgi:hypothetical protein
VTAWTPVVHVDEVAYAVLADRLLTNGVQRERFTLKLSMPDSLLRLIDSALARSTLTSENLYDLFGDTAVKTAQSTCDRFDAMATHTGASASSQYQPPSAQENLPGNEATPLAELSSLAQLQQADVRRTYASWPEGIKIDDAARFKACDNNWWYTRWANGEECREMRMEYFTNWTLAKHADRLSGLEFDMEYRTR